MATDDHVSKFNEGPKAWNSWRLQNRDVVPNVTGGKLDWNLAKKEGTDYDLEGTKLSKGDLPTALDGISFRGAELHDLDFTAQELKADFRLSKLTRINFDDCNLWGCKFSNATLDFCTFKGAKFAKVLDKPHFFGRRRIEESAEFENVLIKNSDFQHAAFAKTSLWRSQFINSDFRDATGMVLDDNVVRNSLFSPYANDEWSVLRRTYTDTNMAFLLFASLIFFLPWAFDAGYWTYLGQVERGIATKVELADSMVDEVSTSEEMKVYLHSLFDQLVDPNFQSCLGRNNESGTDYDNRCLPVWKIMLGWHEESIWARFIGGFLLLFNVLRLFLTWMIAPLRDEERRSFQTPPRNLPAPAQRENIKIIDIRRYYGWMIKFHYILLVMLPIALILGVFNVVPRLFSLVWIP